MNNRIVNELTYPGNTLSSQPEEVRAQFAAFLASRGMAMPPVNGGNGVTGEPRGSMSAPASRSADMRAIDPAVVAAFTTIIDAIAGLMNRSPARDGAPVLDRGEMRKDFITLGPGAIEYFPTWSFWGRTFVRLLNSGTVPTVAMINEDRFHLNPGEQTDKDGLWAAFPVRVVNTIELPGSELKVRVW